MSSRWDVTRAVRLSDLPAPSRLVMLVLADVAEVGTGEIPERFTPSLNVLARETGLDKSTITRHLNLLDDGNWIVRTKPTAEAARLYGERTKYRLTVPAGFVPREIGARSNNVVAEDTTLGAENDKGSCTEQQDLGAESTHPRCTEQQKETDLFRSTDLVRSSDAPHRPDVEEVCEHLADLIEANGSKRPRINKQWRDAARLMLDRDGRTIDQVIKAIDWCQADNFWRTNILSMPKLREKYDQLRLAAQRSPTRGSPGSVLAFKPSTTDQRVAQALEAGARVQAMLEGRPA